MRRIFSKTRLLVAVTALGALMVALMPAPSASAAGPAAVVVEGNASLPEFPAPGGNSGSFAGSAYGANLGTGAALVGTGASASFSYNEPNCALGNASGSLTVTGVGTVPFTWQRVGQTAVIQFGSTIPNTPRGVAIAGFKATAATPTALALACAGQTGGVAVTAQVVGAGLIVN